MYAVAVVRYVKSEILSKELHTRFHKEEVYRVALALLGRFFSLFWTELSIVIGRTPTLYAV